MTSFTKALYRRDPAAAEAFYDNQKFETRHTYGRHPTLPQFTLAFQTSQGSVAAPQGRRMHFGLRSQPPTDRKACSEPCGHPACSHGCIVR